MKTVDMKVEKEVDPIDSEQRNLAEPPDDIIRCCSIGLETLVKK